jgi:hypothetical protein
MDVRDILERAAKTFVQAFLSAVPVEIVIGGQLPALRGAVIAAGAAALSVVWNAALQWASTD